MTYPYKCSQTVATGDSMHRHVRSKDNCWDTFAVLYFTVLFSHEYLIVKPKYLLSATEPLGWFFVQWPIWAHVEYFWDHPNILVIHMVLSYPPGWKDTEQFILMCVKLLLLAHFWSKAAILLCDMICHSKDFIIKY